MTNKKLNKLDSESWIITDDSDVFLNDFVLIDNQILQVTEFNVGVLEKYQHVFGNSQSTCYNVRCGHLICFSEYIRNKKVLYTTFKFEGIPTISVLDAMKLIHFNVIPK